MILAAVLTGVIIFLVYTRIKLNQTDLKGLEENSVCTDVQYEDNSSGYTEYLTVFEDTRFRKVVLENVKYIEIMSLNSYIDVRIRFPDGEDFTVLKDISVEGEDNGNRKVYTAMLSEKEILLYSSAVSDTLSYQGCELYAAGGSERSDFNQSCYIPSENTMSISEYADIADINSSELKVMVIKRRTFENRMAEFLTRDLRKIKSVSVNYNLTEKISE